jgi:hypothetical protein
LEYEARMTSPYIQEAAEKIGILPKTEYRREHYFHAREQSRTLKEMEWEREPVTRSQIFSAAFEFCIGFFGLMGPFCWVVFR